MCNGNKTNTGIESVLVHMLTNVKNIVQGVNWVDDRHTDLKISDDNVHIKYYSSEHLAAANYQGKSILICIEVNQILDKCEDLQKLISQRGDTFGFYLLTIYKIVLVEKSTHPMLF